jgi:hypothetical protein
VTEQRAHERMPRARLLLGRASSRFRRWVTPRSDGLPNARVLFTPLIVMAVLFLALVATGVTGSSTGIVRDQISVARDNDLIAGEPRGIRSDEWFVQTTWIISQVEQGLPIVNESFPGGMDTTVQNDLPSWDWSTAFRPHLWGFYFLPLDQAMAWKWWLPAFGVISSTYVLALSLLPRRPVTSALLAAVFFLSPFLQWWYLSLTLYPLMWSALAASAVVWALKSDVRWQCWSIAAATGYITVTLAMGIYVPFIVPSVLAVFGFAVGALFVRDSSALDLKTRLRRLVPLILSGVIACVVMIIWVYTRRDTIDGFLSTVYPGERLQSVGAADYGQFVQLISGVFSSSLDRTGGQPLNVNASEASTFLLPGLCLVVVAAWIVARIRRDTGWVDWWLIATMGAGALFFIYMYIPGWDGLARLLFLDRTTYSRTRIGIGIVSFFILLLVASRYDSHRSLRAATPVWVKYSAPLLALTGAVLVAIRIDTLMPMSQWVESFGRREAAVVVISAALLALSVLLFASGRSGIGAATLLAVAILQGGLVNPLYRGVADLRETRVVEAIQEIDNTYGGDWVGINGSLLPTMMLVESGVTSYNGVQGYPSEKMWGAIDPESRFEQKWNRLATVSWFPGQGEPSPRNPAPDQIHLTFDSCASFAQEHVDWVLSDVELDQTCLSEVDRYEEGPAMMRIYEVIRQR